MSAKSHDNSRSTDAVKLALMLSKLRLPAMCGSTMLTTC